MDNLRNRLRIACAACALLACACWCRPALADEWKDVYELRQVLSLYLEMSASDWDRIRFDQPSQSQSWTAQVAQAWFYAAGESPMLVSVRRKGESDIPLPSESNPQKVSMKIDFNEYTNQTWHGLNKLSLENGGTDPLLEGFAWNLHRLASERWIYGYDSGYAAWARVYINGEFKGVFVNAEQRDRQFMENHNIYKAERSWLYKVDGSRGALEEGTGTDATYEHLNYEPFTTGPNDPGGVVDPAFLEADMPQWVDVQGMLTLAAVHAFLENRDSLFTHGGKNSFAVDAWPTSVFKRRYYQWDQDTIIGNGTDDIYLGGMGPCAYQVDILCHQWFRQVYQQTMRNLLIGPFAQTNLHAFLDDIRVVLAPHFAQDPYVYSSGGFSNSVDDLKDWVSTRVSNVQAQINVPYIAPPVFSQDGGEVLAGYQLSISAPSGAVYYTLEGSDPRAVGGAVASNAILYTSPITISKATHVNARAFDGALWNPIMAQASFTVAGAANAVRVTEIMYNPKDHNTGDSIDNDHYEFIEFRNTGTGTVDLSDFRVEGIDHTFPVGTTVGPGAFMVLVRYTNAFAARYPSVAIAGEYWGKLDNSGDKIRLRDASGSTVLSVEYDDDPPWHLSPDGMGCSLVVIDRWSNLDDPHNWRASAAVDGSPGAEDGTPSWSHGVVINEVLAHADPPFEDAIELHNMTDSAIAIGGWFLSDDALDADGEYDAASLRKYRIPPGTQIPARGFATFYAKAFDTDNPRVPFSFTEYGESVYLASADASSNLTGCVMGAHFGASENGVSIGRHVTSAGEDFTFLAYPTFGVTNPQNVAEFRTGVGASNAAPKIGPVVVSEIMYNPPAMGDEFLEICNLAATNIDLTDWDIQGMDYTFPTGAVIAGYGYAVFVDTSTTSVAAFRTNHNVPGSVPVWAGSFNLGDDGEVIRIEKPNDEPLAPDILVDRVRYNDRVPWPTEADSEGPSIERHVLDAYGNDPANWRTTAVGGSPGRANVFTGGIVVAWSSSWKYRAAPSDAGALWRTNGYVDSGWPDGDAALGYGETNINRSVPYGRETTNRHITTYFRKEVVLADDPADVAGMFLYVKYDDGFVLYVNGVEVVRRSLPGGSIWYDTAASAHESGTAESIDLTSQTVRFVRGANIIEVELHQESRASDDLFWDAHLAYVIQSGAGEDLDGDGLPDSWEIMHGLSAASGVGRNGPDGDPDGDGMSNMAEYIADTHPDDGDSRLIFIRATRGGGGITLLWQGGQNARQELQQRRALGDTGAWTTVYTADPATPLTNQWFTTSISNAAFYRIRASRN